MRPNSLQSLFEAVVNFDVDEIKDTDQSHLDVEATSYAELQGFAAKHLGKTRILLHRAVRTASLKVKMQPPHMPPNSTD